MPKRRLLLSGLLIFVASLVMSGCMSGGEPSGRGSPSTTVRATLPPQNVEVLEKLNSTEESEKLEAIMPALRENPEVRESLRVSNVSIEVLPETMQVYDFYATVDAQLTGDISERVTYYLQPSDGQWLIANLKRG
ncbi:MAG TPA: hypothetical protein VFT59_04365 [Candidatus Saccharimonadales bacterium]|nr:hypothetical protein [Candidatus Saccharimonadales bacterium]